LRAHNRRVLLVCFFAVIAAGALWLGAYLVSYWLTLLFLSAICGGDARMPAHFNVVFGSAAAIIFAATWVERWLHPHPRPPDKKSRLRVTLDFLFTPARLLFSLRDNLRAWLNLSAAELPVAIAFMDRVRAARKFPLHAMPVEIPDARAQERILFALLHLRLLEMQREGETTWLRYVSQTPAPMESQAGPYLA
jgi:hypothetical protein